MTVILAENKNTGEQTEYKNVVSYLKGLHRDNDKEVVQLYLDNNEKVTLYTSEFKVYESVWFEIK